MATVEAMRAIRLELRKTRGYCDGYFACSYCGEEKTMVDDYEGSNDYREDQGLLQPTVLRGPFHFCKKCVRTYGRS